MAGPILQILGDFRLQDTADAEVRVASRKGRALLGYLAVRPNVAHARDRLARLLWEDADEDLARANLRQALAALRKSLPAAAAALHSDANTLLLDTSLLPTDLDRVRSGLNSHNRATLQSCLTHYRGELLAGLDARSGAFDEWLRAERQSLRCNVLDALQRLASLCTSADDDTGALAAYRQVLSIDPLNEAAHRSTMELHARAGAITEALRQYQACRDSLRRELDVAPEPATQTLYRELMRRRRGEHADTEPSQESTSDQDLISTGVQARAEQQTSLRDAIVMVARFDGLLEVEAAGDPEDAHRLSETLQRLVQEVVQEFGGICDRRVGANCVAVFGIPNAHGNEAVRAVGCACLLRDRFVEGVDGGNGQIRLSIGIAQGQVLKGVDLFPLTGRPAHAAHSLAARAGDQEILLADELKHSLGERITVARRDNAATPHHPAWTLLSLASEPNPQAPFVGRRPELAMAVAALERCAASHHGRVIVLRGPAGIGKTSLSDAIRAAARQRSVATHCAQVYDFGQSPGRRPITLLALSLVGLQPDATAADRTAAIEAIVTSAGSSMDQRIFLSELIHAPMSSELAALERAMDAATRQRGRTQSLARLIESASQHRALLLLVEDVHWAASDELAQIGEIAAAIANCRALLILTTRPEGDPTGTAWRARARGCPITTIELEPLAVDEAQELARHYDDLPADTVAACIERAAGYPLFLDQLLRTAASQGQTLPTSVRALVVAQADTLGSGDHRALDAAAVLGHRLPLDALRTLLGDADYQPSGLVASGLMHSVDAELQFAHALFRDAIYESLLKSQRRDLHLRAAEWFSARDIVLHAEHLAAAEDERAVAAYEAAALAAQTALRFEQALNLAGKAYALGREPRALHHISRLMGELQLQSARTHDALTSYREALDFATDPVDKGLALFGIAAALRVMDRYDEALDSLDRAEALLATHPDQCIKARLCTLRGNLYFPMGRMDACLAAHEQALVHAQAAQSPAQIARAHGGIGDAWYQRGHMLSARAQFTQCIEAARRHGLTDVLIANLPMLGVSLLYSGELAAAERNLDETLLLVRQIGDVRGELIVQLVAAGGLLIQGRVQECRDRAQRAIELAQQLSGRRFHAEALGILASTLIADGHNDSALGVAQQALEIVRQTGMSYCGPSVLSIAARATTDCVQRAALLAEGEEILARGCVSHAHFEFYNNAIEVSLREGLTADARRYAQAFEDYSSSEPSAWTKLLVRRARALADVADRPADVAATLELKAVRDACVRLNARILLALIDQALNVSV